MVREGTQARGSSVLSTWSRTSKDLAVLIREVRQVLLVPLSPIVSDGQAAIRSLVAWSYPEALGASVTLTNATK